MTTLKHTLKLTLTAAIAALLFATAGNAVAETQWAKNHPRRHEVNHRLNHQDRRIHQEVKEGEISHGEARQLHAEDHQVRREERAMAAQNGGHITKAEQHALNQQIGR
jgi:coenzyme F420-reducing hydrogenase beta subunit